MNILLTGSNGFLGKELYNKLSKYNVQTLSRTNSDYNINLAKSVPSFFSTFELVIHAAGQAHFHPKTEIEKSSFFNINVLGTKNLLEGLTKSIPKRFVFISSVSVYGIDEGENIIESSELNAVDSYGKSKIEAEIVVRDWCIKHNVICTIFRLPLVVGPNPPGNLGAMIKGINNGYYFNISGGIAKKSMVLASDIAKYVLIASEIGGIYNLTDGIHPTFCDLSNNIASKLGKSFVPTLPFFLAKLLAKFGDLLGLDFPLNTNKLIKITSSLTFDDSKARKFFGWKPKSVLEELNFDDTFF